MVGSSLLPNGQPWHLHGPLISVWTGVPLGPNFKLGDAPEVLVGDVVFGFTILGADRNRH